MNTIRNIAEIDDFTAIAHDLSELLVRDDNRDIQLEFPGSFERYNGDAGKAAANLQAAKEACQPGVRQQFVAFVGGRAVGLSAIRVIQEVPQGVEPSWPNVESFVCNPYRNRGVGRLSLLERLKVVHEQFGDDAWTKVHKQNEFSDRMVRGAGFVIIGEEDDSFVYAYHG